LFWQSPPRFFLFAPIDCLGVPQDNWQTNAHSLRIWKRFLVPAQKRLSDRKKAGKTFGPPPAVDARALGRPNPKVELLINGGLGRCGMAPFSGGQSPLISACPPGLQTCGVTCPDARGPTRKREKTCFHCCSNESVHSSKRKAGLVCPHCAKPPIRLYCHPGLRQIPPPLDAAARKIGRPPARLRFQKVSEKNQEDVPPPPPSSDLPVFAKDKRRQLAPKAKRQPENPGPFAGRARALALGQTPPRTPWGTNSPLCFPFNSP